MIGDIWATPGGQMIVLAIVFVISLPIVIVFHWKEYGRRNDIYALVALMIVGPLQAAAMLSAFGLIALAIVNLLPPLTPLLSKEWVMGPALVITVGFYRLRGTHPFIYGAAEILIGTIATWSGIHADTTSVISKALAFFGGLYVIVRGLDNMDKGLPSSMRPWWNEWFPKAKSS